MKVESSGEDPRATEGLVSNLPHPRVNKIKQLEHTLFRLFKTSGAFFIFGIKIKQQPWPWSCQSQALEQIELPAKLLDYFLRSNESNIMQTCRFALGMCSHLVQWDCMRYTVSEVLKREAEKGSAVGWWQIHALWLKSWPGHQAFWPPDGDLTFRKKGQIDLRKKERKWKSSTGVPLSRIQTR